MSSRVTEKNQLLFRILPFLLAGLFLSIWLVFTPPGFFSKFHAIGYSVCHQIAERSFSFFGKSMPLCSRCTGMYIGALAGFAILLPGARRTSFPGKKQILALLGLGLLFVVDGINSFLQLFPSAPHLYETQNWLRLITGSGMGLAIPVFLVPIFNTTTWKSSLSESILDKWWKLPLLLLTAVILDATILLNNPYILMIMSVISVLMVVFILCLVYAVLWMLLLKREMQIVSFQQLSHWLAIGFATSLVQIGSMDAFRYMVTGTWAGFIF